MLRKASLSANEAVRGYFRNVRSGKRARILRLGLPGVGKKEAQQWVRDLRSAIVRQLSIVPKGFPLAPEDDEFAEEIRQLIVGRYRVLFTIRKAKFTSFMCEAPTIGNDLAGDSATLVQP